MTRGMSDAARLLELLWDRYAASVPYARTFVRLAGDRLRTSLGGFGSRPSRL